MYLRYLLACAMTVNIVTIQANAQETGDLNPVVEEILDGVSINPEATDIENIDIYGRGADDFDDNIIDGDNPDYDSMSAFDKCDTASLTIGGQIYGVPVSKALADKLGVKIDPNMRYKQSKFRAIRIYVPDPSRMSISGALGTDSGIENKAILLAGQLNSDGVLDKASVIDQFSGRANSKKKIALSGGTYFLMGAHRFGNQWGANHARYNIGLPNRARGSCAVPFTAGSDDGYGDDFNKGDYSDAYMQLVVDFLF